VSVSPALLSTAQAWLAADPDPETRAELDALIQAKDPDLADRFAGPLVFGTAGLRGVVGAGESRMNRATVIRTTAGLARHLLAEVPNAAERGVVLGRDARRGSAEFLRDAAMVLSAAGIPAHVFDATSTETGLAATPLVAYAVRALGAAAGVMITASHNPPEYNGYKVYADNGAQIVTPTDAAIAAAIVEAPPANAIALDDRLVRSIDRTVVDGYLHEIVARTRRSEGRADLRIVYTPMHGVGDAFAHALFDKMGFAHVQSVPAQARPDGTFPTVRFPNPEEPGALDLALALAKQTGADLLIANDPDADRLAIAVPKPDGTFVPLTGNEVGVLLGHYLLADTPSPVADPIAVTTIVSSPLLGRICRALGVRYAETLTGFKWIANKGLEIEAQTGATFVIGYEEALGYAIDGAVRDKDGLAAAARFAEMAASLKARGETVLGRLEAIHRAFGLVVSAQHNVTRKGVEGAAQIKAEMAAARAKPLRTIGGLRVVGLRDYLARVRTTDAGTTEPLDLPSSDVLAFELEGGSRVTMRPSGTEPKVKYYFDVVEIVGAGEAYGIARTRAEETLARVMHDFVVQIGGG
jgi:phosphomannomutase